MSDPSFTDPNKQIEYGQKTSQPWLVSNVYQSLVKTDTNNIDQHFKLLEKHFDVNQEMGPSALAYNQEGTFIYNYYTSWTKSTNIDKADKGHLFMALYYFYKDDFTLCQSHLESVQNDKLKYLNTYRGRMNYYYGNPDQAFQSFAKEIKRYGDLKGAYLNLSAIYDYEKRYDDLAAFAYDDYVKQFIPFEYKQRAYITHYDFYNYFKTLLRQIFKNSNIIGFLGALLILVIWVVYLRRVNVYQKRNWGSIVFTILFSAVCVLPVWLLYDTYRYLFEFELNGNVLNDFLYCVFGIGVIEELVKIIPFLIILRFTKVINEPIDYIMYASLSALGFAFVENFGYFEDGSINIIHSRALTASVAHMIFTSVIAYGLILAKYKYKKNTFLFFIGFFFIAAFMHGFYDFWLLNKYVSDYYIFTFVCLLTGILVYSSFINNALNNSLTSSDNLKLNTSKLSADLAAYLIGVFLFEYLCMSFIYGPTIGNREFISSTIGGGYLILFLSIRLSNIDIIPEEWSKIDFFVGLLPAQIIYGDKKPNYNSLIGKKLEFKAFRAKGLLFNILPVSGEIIKREKISGFSGWFLVKLDQPLKINKAVTDHVLIRAKERQALIENKNNTIISFVAIPDMKLLETDSKNMKDFIFIDWAVAN
jgi:RsiW-degrading membrane proteinase PrsW (M82 family)